LRDLAKGDDNHSANSPIFTTSITQDRRISRFLRDLAKGDDNHSANSPIFTTISLLQLLKTAAFPAPCGISPKAMTTTLPTLQYFYFIFEVSNLQKFVLKENSLPTFEAFFYFRNFLEKTLTNQLFNKTIVRLLIFVLMIDLNFLDSR